MQQGKALFHILLIFKILSVDFKEFECEVCAMCIAHGTLYIAHRRSSRTNFSVLTQPLQHTFLLIHRRPTDSGIAQRIYLMNWQDSI